jgi:hypothetical protein
MEKRGLALLVPLVLVEEAILAFLINRTPELR